MNWRMATLIGYVLVAAVGGIVEMVGRRGTASVPTVDQVLRWVLQTRSGRIAVFAAWAWLGLHFLG
jgi:hypothetical protein